jgi:cytochrome P450
LKLADGDNADKKAYPVVLDEALKVTKDPVEIRGVLLSLMVAGRDTTASLLSKFWFVLAREPRTSESLQKEIDGLNGEKPTFSALKDLHYLQNFLKEGE